MKAPNQKTMILLGVAAVGAFLVLRNRSSGSSDIAAPFPAGGGGIGGTSAPSSGGWGLPTNMTTTPTTFTGTSKPEPLSESGPLATTNPVSPPPVAPVLAPQAPVGAWGGGGSSASNYTHRTLADGSVQVLRGGVLEATITPDGYRTYPDGSGDYIAKDPKDRDWLMKNWGYRPW